MIKKDKRIVVVYKTKYGSSERYAKWIADEVGADLFKKSQVSVKKLLNYDVIVYAGSLYAGGMLGVSLIKKNFEILKEKKVVLLSVGASYGKEENLKYIKKENFSEKMLNNENVYYFHLQGSLDYKKIKLFDRLLMHMLISKIKKKDPAVWDDDEKGIVASYGRTAKMTKKKNIESVIKCINQL